MLAFKVKSAFLPGSSYKDVRKHAREVFSEAKGKTKRKFYIKSQHFKKQKIFFDYFWNHILEKRPPDRVRRLKLLLCAFELIRNSTHPPEEKKNPKNQKEMLYRFYGQTSSELLFVVQIKRATDQKTLQCISIFPIK